jgi:glucose/arabinose dehydrogenase
MYPLASRRRLLRLLGVGIAGGLAGCSQSTAPARDGTDATGDATDADDSRGAASSADTLDDDTGSAEPGASRPSPPDAVALETLATGLGAPLAVAFAPDADRRYVADQAGRLLVHDADGLRDRPALDLRGRLEAGGEKGLLGVALHPAFATNRRLFVRYSAPSRPGTPSGFSHTFVLSEFRFDEAGTRVDPDSERTLLEVPQPQSNHNAGDLAFGPDGLLYVAVGDGGAAADQGRGHVEDRYDAVGGGNGQDVTENLLGSILRLDVDSAGEDEPYAIPDDNPLVGRAGLDEQYAWGFRNPWRLSFDGTDLFVGDVGQSAYEEVSLVEAGGNYGWNVREGRHCFRAGDCPTTGTDGEPLVDPIVEYPHGGAPVSGISVIGGAVYRGSAFPAARGVYLFGDFRVDGRLFAATRPANGGEWPTTTVDLAGDAPRKLQQLRSFGRDADGELYVVGMGSEGGGLFRLVPAE